MVTESCIRYRHPTSKVVCVGRNYAAHAKELNNPIPNEPLLFIKSTNTLTDFDNRLRIPSGFGECHYELEVAILIGENLSKGCKEEALAAIDGIGLALDLTFRDLQQKLKDKKQPWEKAKSFDNACPVTEFYRMDELLTKGEKSAGQLLSDLNFSLDINDTRVQQGDTSNMLFDIPTLVQEASKYFTLYKGDILLTGTPEGVGILDNDDKLTVSLNDQEMASTQINIET